MPWNCPHCAEQHGEPFEVCWKCGSDRTGVRDPEFQIAEALPDDAALTESAEEEETYLPRLPALTYYSIPVCMWLGLLLYADEGLHFFAAPIPHEAVGQAVFKPLSPLDIAFFVALNVLIAIPIAVVSARWLFAEFVGRPTVPTGSFFLWLFRVPESIRVQRPWFVPVYYGSIGVGGAAHIVLPFVGLFLDI